jgi:hypothetical protein
MKEKGKTKGKIGKRKKVRERERKKDQENKYS